MFRSALSAIAAFSKYHFHRQFSEFFGITVHRYVQLVRLKRASYRLAFRDDESALERSRFFMLSKTSDAELAHRLAYSWPR